MPSDRITIYVGEPLRRLLDDHDAGDETSLRSVSGLIAAVADRYHALVRRQMPTLTEAEWCLVMDALNGVWATPAEVAVSTVPIGVADSIRLDGLADKWGVDGDHLIAKLEAMPWPQLLAIVDAAERWWAKDWGDTPRGESIRAVVGERCVE